MLTKAMTDEIVADPGQALVELVGLGSALFYWAEHEVNPDVQDVWDAFHYISTCLSVGYAKIFPVTPAGKAIGGLVMMIGPALSARALDPPGGEADGQAQVVAKLDEILVELRRLGS